MSKNIAVFDFDGTITNSDSLWKFLKYSKTKACFYFGCLINLPLLTLAALGLYSRSKAKEHLIGWFFRGYPKSDFLNLCEHFADAHECIIRDSATEEIKRHQKSNHIVIIITASPIEWVIPFAKKLDIPIVLGTQLEYTSEGKLTGHFSSKNCTGSEKVKALLTRFPNREQYTLYTYGDSSGDKELLDFSDYKYFRKLK